MNIPAVRIEPAFRGFLEAGPDQVEYRTSFPAGLRFKCLAGCGLCCRTYRIPLTAEDLSRLRRVVEPEKCSTIALENGVPEGQSGVIAGFMENGKHGGCCYLDGYARCSVYDSRPLYCRTYPLIRDIYGALEMSVDRSCPGVGVGAVVRREQIEEAFLLEAEYRPESLNVLESSAGYEVIYSSLKTRGVFTDGKTMRSVCATLVEQGLSFSRGSEIVAFFSAASAALGELLAEAGNLNGPEAGTRLIEELEERLSGKQTVPAECLSNAFSERQEPMQVCLGEGHVPRHLLIHANDRFLLLEAQAVLGEIEPGRLEENELSEEAARALAGYLAEWIARQALLRFVHAEAVARPRGVNVLQSFFEFLVHTACRVLITAEVLRKHGGGRTVAARTMREAIRANEGPLRSRCASVVSRY